MALLTTTEIENELQQGRIPEPLRENHCLLPEAHPAAIAFVENAHRITGRLLGPSYDPSTLRFMLSADREPNAFIITGVNPPLIVVTRGLIELAKTEDEIAGVIAHELNHQYLHDKLGIHDNSKGEEAFADTRAILMLRNADYRQDAIRTLMERLSETAMSIFATIRDPHPKKDMRIRLCSNAEKAINLNALEGKGEQHTPPMRRPDDLMQLLDKAVYTGRHIENVLRAEGFEKAAPLRQLQIMNRIVPQELVNIGGKDNGYYDFRVCDLANAIGTIKADAGSSAQKKAMDTLVETLLSAPEKFMRRNPTPLHNHINVLYVGAVKAWTGKAPEEDFEAVHLIGGLKGMSDAMNSFINTKSAAEAEKSANAMNVSFDHYYDKGLPIRGNFIRDLPWPKLKEPMDYDLDIVQWRINSAAEKKKNRAIHKYAIKASWDPQVRWAEATGSKAIAIALHNLGVRDPRLPALTPEEESRNSRNTFNKPWEYDHAPDGRLMGAKGSIYTATNPRPLTAEEKMDRKDELEANLLKTSDWKKEMEGDFHGFVAKYKEQLLPILRSEDDWNKKDTGGATFAESFCDHLKILIAKEPARYKPLAEHFFSVPAGSNPPGLNQLIDEHLESIRHEHMHKPNYLFSIRHPYTRFAMENPSGALSLPTQLQVMDRSSYYVSKNDLKSPTMYDGDVATPYGSTKYDKCWHCDPEKFHPLPALNSFADLTKLMEGIKGDPVLLEAYDNSCFYQDKVRYHVTRFLERTKSPCTTGELAHVIDVYDKYYAKIPHTQLEELMVRQLERNVNHEFAANPPAKELVENYLAYSREELFDKKPALKRAYEVRLIREIKALDNPAEKKMLAWRLLSSHHRLEQPEFREFAVQTYVKTSSMALGKENAQTHGNIRNTIDHIFENTSGDVRYSLLTRMADATETQRKLTFDIQKKLGDNAIDQIVKTKMSAALGEGMLDLCSRDEKMRIATLDYMTTPLTERSLQTYRRTLINAAKAEIEKHHGEEYKEFLTAITHDASRIEKLR